jgi:Uncharacterised nucleotidyltransferase
VTQGGREAELRAVLACARLDGATSGAGNAFPTALAATTDWERLRDIAIGQGMMGLLCRRAVELPPSTMPEAVFKDFRTMYRANSQRILRMTGQLVRLLALMRRSDIAAVAYKGPVLSEFAYGDAAVRQTVDLDILVRAQDVIHAAALLEVNGFRRVEPRSDVPARALLRDQCEVVLERGNRDPIVELHWRVGQRFAAGSIDAALLIGRGQPSTLLGVEVPALCPEDVLLTLALHGARHAWETLELITTFGAVINKLADEQQERALKTAEQHRCLRRFLVACLVARDVVGARVSSTVENRALADHLAVRLARLVQDEMFSGVISGRFGLPMSNLLWQAKAHDSPWDGMTHFLRRLATPSYADWDAVRLPFQLWGLYFVIRALRFVGFFQGSRTDVPRPSQASAEP